MACKSAWFAAQVPIRFWAKVAKTDGCWEWQGTRTKDGYGQTKSNRVSVYTHRLSWEMAHGAIPPGMTINHTCDNPPCVRPDHLVLGTQQSNMVDMKRRGRASGGTVQGSRVGTARLTEATAAAIRAEYAQGTSKRALAQKYGVARPTIYKLLAGETWRHVEG